MLAPLSPRKKTGFKDRIHTDAVAENAPQLADTSHEKGSSARILDNVQLTPIQTTYLNTSEIFFIIKLIDTLTESYREY